jgi:hypothetical protein
MWARICAGLRPAPSKPAKFSGDPSRARSPIGQRGQRMAQQFAFLVHTGKYSANRGIDSD